MLEAYSFLKQNLSCPNKFIRWHKVYILLSLAWNVKQRSSVTYELDHYFCDVKFRVVHELFFGYSRITFNNIIQAAFTIE